MDQHDSAKRSAKLLCIDYDVYTYILFELELILSSIIKALGLDNISSTFDWKKVVKQLSTQTFRDNFEMQIQSEMNLYSHSPEINTDIIQIYGQQISRLTISIDDIKSSSNCIII